MRVCSLTLDNDFLFKVTNDICRTQECHKAVVEDKKEV